MFFSQTLTYLFIFTYVVNMYFQIINVQLLVLHIFCMKKSSFVPMISLNFITERFCKLCLSRGACLQYCDQSSLTAVDFSVHTTHVITANVISYITYYSFILCV